MTFSRSATVTIASVVLFGSTACVTPSNTPDVPPLTNTIWELQQIQFNDGKLLVADPPQNYTAQFTDEGEVFVQADCNRSIGQFTEESDGRLMVTMGPTTLAACPPGSIGTDFLQALNNSNLYFFQNEDLFIDLAFDSGTMQFSASDSPALVGTVWQLKQIQSNDGQLFLPNPPENYTVEFMADGSVSVQADCNRGNGQFITTDDNGLTIDQLATTRAACPPESISNQFLQGLSNSAIFFFQDGDLFIDQKFGSGTLQFTPQ
ncbi:MAG: META domain-containing protein [Leptolyngbyaceae cyanobacterium SM2_3_12]|nr:META domain-containing protein [Leptolyngbyaceae cyanobacterium SM2_3_12]